jgi:hypothetical protein
MDGQPFSVEAAREAARRDRLGQWVDEFLRSPGSDNAALAELLAERPRYWTGPVLVPLRQLNRLAGPPDHPVLCPVEDDEWRDDVDELADDIEEEGVEPPPMIVSFRDESLVLEDGNHRVEALRRAGEHEAWAVISFESTDHRDRFTLPSAP